MVGPVPRKNHQRLRRRVLQFKEGLTPKEGLLLFRTELWVTLSQALAWCSMAGGAALLITATWRQIFPPEGHLLVMTHPGGGLFFAALTPFLIGGVFLRLSYYAQASRRKVYHLMLARARTRLRTTSVTGPSGNMPVPGTPTWS